MSVIKVRNFNILNSFLSASQSFRYASLIFFWFWTIPSFLDRLSLESIFLSIMTNLFFFFCLQCLYIELFRLFTFDCLLLFLHYFPNLLLFLSFLLVILLLWLGYLWWRDQQLIYYLLRLLCHSLIFWSLFQY